MCNAFVQLLELTKAVTLYKDQSLLFSKKEQKDIDFSTYYWACRLEQKSLGIEGIASVTDSFKKKNFWY